MNKTICSILTSVTLLACTSSSHTNNNYIKEEGFVFGTTYHITYKYHRSLQSEMLEQLKQYDNSLSPYNPNSIISRINRNEDVEVDSLFANVYNQACKMYELSEGRFDITVEPLSKLWKFSGDHPDTIAIATYDSIVSLVDSIRAFVGLKKTHLENNKLIKADPRITINANAIAEGYGIDVAASVFEKHGVTDYMVEIGGELHIKGLSPRGQKWRVSIDRPDEGSNELTRTSQSIITVTDCAISTSGSYRQFYYTTDGRRLQHTIDPATGRPVEHGMLSVTTIGPNTMTTDAWSTTFMVMGPHEAIATANKIDGIEAYVIYQDEEGNRHEIFSDGFKTICGMN